MIELYGCGVSNGVAIGRLSFYNSNKENVPEYEIVDIDKELERYRIANQKAKKHLDGLYKSTSEKVSKNESLIFHMHRMLLDDSRLIERIEENISKKKENAELAIKNAALTISEGLKSVNDSEYFQERCCDIIDAANNIIGFLINNSDDNSSNSDEPVIIAANELLPSETISFNKDKVLGFVTNRGSNNSHSSILARTLGIPSVVKISDSLSSYNGMTAIIDGQLGKVIINPDISTISLYRAKKERYNKQQALLKKQLGLKSVTKNGQEIRLSANIGLLEDIESAKSNDAEGIGLFRSEFLFLRRDKAPDENEQFEAYKTAIKSMPKHSTIIRTIDIGADKQISYLNIPKEKNPAMGMRGIRVCLSNPEFFKVQLRALYRASAYGKLRISLPMINSIDEIDFVKRLIKEVRDELKLQKIPFDENTQLGVTIETPAAAMISDKICRAVDFVSIGTNDLTQYTLAMDRENPTLEYLYQPYHTAILRLIKLVADNAHKNNTWVSICGELAADTSLTDVFLAMGIDELSMVPSKILKLRAKVRECNTENKEEILKDII